MRFCRFQKVSVSGCRGICGRSLLTLDEYIGCRLRQLREDKEVDPTKVAAILGISLERYTAFELGHGRISAQHFLDLCQHFDVTVTYFVADYESHAFDRDASSKPNRHPRQEKDGSDWQRRKQHGRKPPES